MPALGITQRTTDKPLKKWPAPLMAHLVYGTATAAAYEALESIYSSPVIPALAGVQQFG